MDIQKTQEEIPYYSYFVMLLILFEGCDEKIYTISTVGNAMKVK